jgi:hypothetical protein
MLSYGALAQLGERLICIQEVVGSIPSGSTRPFDGVRLAGLLISTLIGIN